MGLAWRCSLAALRIGRSVYRHANRIVSYSLFYDRLGSSTLQPSTLYRCTTGSISLLNTVYTHPWRGLHSGRVLEPYVEQLKRSCTVDDLRQILDNAGTNIWALTTADLAYTIGRLSKQYAKSPATLRKDPLWRQLVGRYKQDYPLMHPKFVSSSICALQKLGLQDEPLLLGVVVHLTPLLHRLPTRQLVNFMYTVAKDRQQDAATPSGLRPEYTAFFTAASKQVSDMASSSPAGLVSQGISNAMYACALVSHIDAQMFTSLAAAAQPKLYTFTPQALSNMLCAWAKLVDAGMQDLPPTFFCYRLASEAGRQADQFEPQAISNLLWAWAKLCAAGLRFYPAEPALDVLAQQVSSKAQQFKPQDISNLLWAWAKLVEAGMQLHPPTHTCHALAQQVIRQAPQFTPQSISNTLWAWAKLIEAGLQLDASAQACLNSLAHEAIHQAQHFNSQAVSNVLWAWAVLQDRHGVPPHPQLFNAMADQAINIRQQLNHTQHISNILWATAVIHKAAATPAHTLQLCDALAAEGAARISDFEPQHLANSTWALSRLRYHHGPLLAAVASAAAALPVTAFRPQDVASTVYGLAGFGQPLPAKLLACLEHHMPQLTPQELCKSAWALAVSAASSSSKGGASLAVLARLVQQLSAAQLSKEQQRELHQVQLLLTSLGVHHNSRLAALRRAQLSKSDTSSAFQQQVVRAMQQLLSQMHATATKPAATPRVDLLDPRCPKPIDIALQWDGWPVALEAFGPKDFSCNQPYKLLGEAWLRSFLLRSSGWLLVEVPCYEWDVLDGAHAQQQYLRSKLDAASCGAAESGVQIGSPQVVRALRMLRGS